MSNEPLSKVITDYTVYTSLLVLTAIGLCLLYDLIIMCVNLFLWFGVAGKTITVFWGVLAIYSVIDIFRKT